MASAQAWPFLPRLCFLGTVLAAGSLGGQGALLCPPSQKRTNVFFSSSALLPLLLAPLICFLLSGISLPVYPPQQKMPVLLRRIFQKEVWVKISDASHSEGKEIPIKWSNPGAVCVTEAVMKQSIVFVGYSYMLRLYFAALSAKTQVLSRNKCCSNSNGKMNLLPLHP